MFCSKRKQGKVGSNRIFNRISIFSDNNIALNFFCLIALTKSKNYKKWSPKLIMIIFEVRFAHFQLLLMGNSNFQFIFMQNIKNLHKNNMVCSKMGKK